MQPFKEFDDLVYDSLEYLGGYISKRINKTVSKARNECPGSSTFTWIDHISEGGLVKPSEEFMEDIQNLERIFEVFNGDGLSFSNNFLKNLLNKARDFTSCSEQAQLLFFRTRLYFRIKSLNKSLLETSFTRKRKIVKTVI